MPIEVLLLFILKLDFCAAAPLLKNAFNLTRHFENLIIQIFIVKRPRILGPQAQAGASHRISTNYLSGCS